MRILTCLTVEHSIGFVLMAALMCAIGSFVTVRLYRRAIDVAGLPRRGWLFMTAVCAGSSIWATHFIAMLGYRPGAPIEFDAVLTLGSIIIAIVGTGLGFAIAAASPSRGATIIGGGCVGLAIAAMHYTGMFAYSVQGIVTWDPAHIVASLVLSVLFAIATLGATRRWRRGWHRQIPVALFVLGIVSLHFTGMAAFQVSPLAGVGAETAVEGMQAMALAVLLVGLLTVGTGISTSLIDDRNRAASTEQLRIMAFEDPLTGLANRRALQRRLGADLEKGVAVSLLLVDLDFFKAVNDTFGHTVGDRVLADVARRIRASVGWESFAARIGGDEFAVLVYGDADCADAVAGDLVRAFDRPVEIEELALMVGLSVGVCSIGEGESAEDLLRRADVALYEAKRLGRRRAFRYQPGMLEDIAARHRLESDLTNALEAGQFHLVYQPLVQIGTGDVIGYEALIRWDHPERGLVPPSEFIPLAEESGAIVAIGRWVLKEATRSAAAWGADRHVAVNVSAIQLRSATFLNDVVQALAESGLSPSRLEIELTETAIVTDGRLVAHTLAGIHTLGVRIAMDDFGTGYSSLAHLRDLPLDRIKIDRSFVASAGEDGNSLAVLKAITQLGRDMGITTLGEGVETVEQLQLLQSLGCDAVQGFLLGRPDRMVAEPARRHAAGMVRIEDPVLVA